MSTYLFGGGIVNPAQVAYAEVSLTSDLTFIWPIANTDSTNVLARQIDVTADASNRFIILPPADQTGVGMSVVINNVGAYTFGVKDNAGNFLGNVSSTTSYYYYVSDNSSAAGVWGQFAFGSSPVTVSASALAGPGLAANGSNQLYISTTAESFSTALYAFVVNDRDKLKIYTGGGTTMSLSSPATYAAGWQVYFKNAGGGTVTITPVSGTIDGQVSLTFAPSDAAVIFCDGANFFTLGRGQSLTFTYSTITMNVAGTGEYPGAWPTVLSAAESAAQMQVYSGILTGNRTVNYGTNLGVYYVYNNTTGAFSLTLRATNADAGFVVPQGTRVVITNDGTNVRNAITSSAGTVTSITAGTGLTGGTITGSGTIALDVSGVVAGTYDFPSITVDTYGRATAVTTSNNASVATKITLYTNMI
jgi:hypothetical protein